MATINSNRNDNAGAHVTVSPLSTTTWSGGVVPGAADQAYILGRRTTINQSAISKWAGTISITVASTANFKSIGYFYTVTDRSEILKINYTGITSNTFTGCSLDESDPFYTWTDGGTIFNGSYVHNPAYIIEVAAGQTFEVNELIIQEGGWLFVNGGTLKINQGIIVRDGRLIGRGNGTIIISRNSQNLSSSYIGYLNAEDYRLSIIDIDGGENRTYSTLTAPAVPGDVSVTINTPTNGSFAVGDEVAIYEQGKPGYRRRITNHYRGDASHSFKDMDEGFDVCGVSGNTIYLANRNSSRGYTKEVFTIGGQKVLNIKPEISYFKAGDITVINNKKYIIAAVEDSEYTLYNYDFTNPATSLSDFWVGDSTHVYSAGWNIESGVGLRTGTDSYRELVHKYYWDREVIIEAEMSPLSAYYSGTRGNGKYSILTSYDPSFRWGHRGDDSFKTDYFQVDDANDRIHFYIKNMANYNNNRLSRETAFRNETRTAAKYIVDTRKGRTTTYINGVEFSTDFRRDGNYKGLVGLQASNQYFRCKSLIIKVPTQKLYITTTDSFSVNDVVYHAGIENNHPAGSKIVKIAAINTGNGTHGDLAFAYRGQTNPGQSIGNGEWPLIIQENGATITHSSIPYVHNHDLNPDYYRDLTNAQTAKSLTIDLLSQKTFSHVSFRPRINDYATYYGFNGVAIYGSNDLSNWTTLYGPTNDTKKFYYDTFNQLAFYPTGTVSYRYVKFETKGAQVSPYTNRYVNIGVHDFSTGYKIGLNNASDFNVGDKISVMTDSGYAWGSREIQAYYAWVSNNASDPETFWHGGWLPECTITGKDGNIITLDRPVFWGYIENYDSVTVVKTNKNFTITGTMGPTNSANDWRWPNINLAAGSSNGRINFFKNARLAYIGSYRNGGSSSNNRGIICRSYDYWNQTVFDGISQIMSQDGTTWGGLDFYSGNGIVRNSFITGGYCNIVIYYPASYSGNAFFNNKLQNNILGIRAEYPRAYSINYNEIAGCETGIVMNTNRTDRMSIPYTQEIRRNFIKGTSYAGLAVNNHTAVGAFGGPRVKIEYNKIKGSDDYGVAASTSTDSPYSYLIAHSEHTGSRMSRYRNEGFTSNGDTLSDLNYINMLKDYGRYGYDLIHGVYYIYERDYTRPDIIRVYNPNGDANFPMFGIEIDILEDNVPIQVYVQFDYKYPRISRLQDDGTDDGRLRLIPIQHAQLAGSVQYGTIPSSLGDGWNTFTGTFNGFSSTTTEGKAAVYLNRSAQNGYVDIRNMVAYVLTDYPDKVRVVGNTFNTAIVFDQMRQSKDTRPLTAPTRATKVTRIKF